MNALLNTLEHFLELIGVLLVLLFIAWALVMLGLLADSRFLLHLEKSNSWAKKQAHRALREVGKRDAEQHRKKAA